MSIIVIGGHSRNVGKTSVVAGLIAALPEYKWTAFKITQYGHGVCSLNGRECQCATDDHNWAISEEHDRSEDSDTSRFLVAGAVRVWWVRTEQGRLVQAMPAIREKLAESGNAILESNSVLEFVQPDVYLTILDPANADFKKSALQFLDRASAVILHNNGGAPVSTPRWKAVSFEAFPTRPIFYVRPPEYVTPEIVDFVRRSL